MKKLNNTELKVPANLIAAAPEMLAMLEKLEWCESSYFCPICGRSPEMGGHDNDCKLNLLLQKARG